MLVVDDDVDTADLVTDELRSAGYEVGAVYNGRDALKAVITFRPHLVVLDVDMPEVSGWQVAASLRADPAYADVMLIAHAERTEPTALDRLSQAGFNRYLPKRAPEGVLKVMVANCLLFTHGD